MTTLDIQGLPESEVELPESFVPTIKHVIIGRGKKSYNHTGNVQFRSIVHSRLQDYAGAKTKNQKSQILADTIQKVHEAGGFVKENPSTGRWATAGSFLAREKTSQTFRDMLSSGYRSSKASKKRRRQAHHEDSKLIGSSNWDLQGLRLHAVPSPVGVHTTSSSTFCDSVLGNYIDFPCLEHVRKRDVVAYKDADQNEIPLSGTSNAILPNLENIDILLYDMDSSPIMNEEDFDTIFKSSSSSYLTKRIRCMRTDRIGAELSHFYWPTSQTARGNGDVCQIQTRRTAHHPNL